MGENELSKLCKRMSLSKFQGVLSPKSLPRHVNEFKVNHLQILKAFAIENSYLSRVKESEKGIKEERRGYGEAPPFP